MSAVATREEVKPMGTTSRRRIAALILTAILSAAMAATMAITSSADVAFAALEMMADPLGN